MVSVCELGMMKLCAPTINNWSAHLHIVYFTLILTASVDANNISSVRVSDALAVRIRVVEPKYERKADSVATSAARDVPVVPEYGFLRRSARTNEIADERNIGHVPTIDNMNKIFSITPIKMSFGLLGWPIPLRLVQGLVAADWFK
jgi:hypothetical protein